MSAQSKIKDLVAAIKHDREENEKAMAEVAQERDEETNR